MIYRQRSYIQRSMTSSYKKEVEGEGALRVLLLAFTLVMPFASMAYVKIQHTRFSYAMSEVHNQIIQQEELQRQLLLARSRYQRDEEVKIFAERAGLSPRKQIHFVPRSFTQEDQRLAKLTTSAMPTL